MKNTFIEEMKKLDIKFKTMTSEDVFDNELKNLEILISGLPDTKVGGCIAVKFSELVEELYYGEMQHLPNSMLRWMAQYGYEV